MMFVQFVIFTNGLMEKLVITLLAVSLASGESQFRSSDQLLFESFVANYSRGYRNEPDTWISRFRIFQVDYSS